MSEWLKEIDLKERMREQTKKKGEIKNERRNCLSWIQSKEEKKFLKCKKGRRKKKNNLCKWRKKSPDLFVAY